MCFEFIRPVEHLLTSSQGAEWALEFLDRIVGELMSLQLIRAIECLLTSITLIRFIPAVYEQVRLEIVIRLEGFLTDMARELPMSTVGWEMATEIAFTWENLLTVWAAVVMGGCCYVVF